ncbi:MAG TPA: beta-propeller domain-containing protein, partial [Acidimicrobiales bacterium]|nr:beta-propeller domain-containing protein [Acidimicrobiales bacterium]
GAVVHSGAEVGAPAVAGVAATPESAAASVPAAVPYSTTNDQEAGVDEPDLAKTDGRLLVAIRHQPPGVEVASVASEGQGGPRLDSFLPLQSADELFLTGSYVVVLGYASGTPQPETTVTVVSVADPNRPVVVRSFMLPGEEAAARLIAGRVVVVVSSQPELPFVYPAGAGQAAVATASRTNRRLVERSSLAEWIPQVRSWPSGTAWPVDCSAILHPDAAAGLGTVSVVSIDPSSDQPGSQLTIVGDPSAVYASTTSLYVATTSWPAQPYGEGAATTDVHEFDLSDPAAPRYVGSGSVPGSLIGQYAMSEYDGDLRVATTVGSATPPPGEGTAPAQLSDNRVTVLAPRGGALVTIGSLGGLGDGERIYGVRFDGPLGYVVTFEQTDPLYVVDLSDPAHPALEASLPLTGFSSFLQLLNPTWLLGVGQGVDSELRQTGLQLEVFDVADPARPSLASTVSLPGASSPAENDPHALLWWPADSLVAMPVDSPAGPSVYVWRLGSGGRLEQVATISQPATPPSCPCASGEPPCPCVSAGGASCSCAAIASPAGVAPAVAVGPYYGAAERILVVGDALYTVSDAGIMATDMTNWREAAWLAYSGG